MKTWSAKCLFSVRWPRVVFCARNAPRSEQISRIWGYYEYYNIILWNWTNFQKLSWTSPLRLHGESSGPTRTSFPRREVSCINKKKIKIGSGLFNQEKLNFSNVETQVSAAADNKGFMVTTKWVKLTHKPFKATLALPSPWKPASAGASTRYKWHPRLEVLDGTTYSPESLLRQRQFWTSRSTVRPGQGRHGDEGSCYSQVQNFDGRKYLIPLKISNVFSVAIHYNADTWFSGHRSLCWVKTNQEDLLVEEVEAAASPCLLLLHRHFLLLIQRGRQFGSCRETFIGILEKFRTVCIL